MKVNQVQTSNCAEKSYKVCGLWGKKKFPGIKESIVDINILRKKLK